MCPYISIDLQGLCSFSIVLGERATKTPIDRTEDGGMSQNLCPSGTTRGQNNKQTRCQQNKQKHGDDDIKVHFSLLVREYNAHPQEVEENGA